MRWSQAQAALSPCEVGSVLAALGRLGPGGVRHAYRAARQEWQCCPAVHPPDSEGKGVFCVESELCSALGCAGDKDDRVEHGVSQEYMRAGVLCVCVCMCVLPSMYFGCCV